MAINQPQSLMKLTNQNYHSIEANRVYMSNSQYKDFKKCPSMALAKLNGKWTDESKEALLVGSYVHAAFESDEAFEEFVKENSDIIFNSKGKKYAAFVKADEMIATLKNDRFSMFVLNGEPEVIMTAEFAGVPWKIKIDRHNREHGRFADIKTVKSLYDRFYDQRFGWVSFVEARGYTTQMSLYAEIERRYTENSNWIEPLIVAVTKEDPPDKKVIVVDENRIQMELEEIRASMPDVIRYKSGTAEAPRCEKCQYCRETKQLSGVTHYMDLLG